MPTHFVAAAASSVYTFAQQNSPDEITNYAQVDLAATSVSRTDERLTEIIGEALRNTGYLSLRKLEVNVTQGLVVLRGRIPSYYMIQVTQAIVRAVPGVREVRNEMTVVQRLSAPR